MTFTESHLLLHDGANSCTFERTPLTRFHWTEQLIQVFKLADMQISSLSPVWFICWITRLNVVHSMPIYLAKRRSVPFSLQQQLSQLLVSLLLLLLQFCRQSIASLPPVADCAMRLTVRRPSIVLTSPSDWSVRQPTRCCCSSSSSSSWSPATVAVSRQL